MKIIKVTPGEHEEIVTDEPFLNLYRRLGPNIYEHWLGDNHGWLPYRFTDFLEEAYKIWEKENPNGYQRTTNEFTNA